MKKTILAAALAGVAALSAGGVAQAADTVVATTARPTPIDTHGGRLLYSAWDPAVNGYRLTELKDGVTRALPVDPSPRPFEVDMAWGPHNHHVAVYPRCDGDPALEEGTAGCDLYMFDFPANRETALRSANSPGADETSVAVWRDQIVFSRIYRPRDGRRRSYLYTRSITRSGASKRLSARLTRDLDLLGTRAPFEQVNEWSTSLGLARTSGSPRQLVPVPGSGAAVVTGRAVGPTSQDSHIDWMLTMSGDGHDFSEIHRFDTRAGRDFRVAARITGAASGFAAEGGAVYYAVPAGPNAADGCRPGEDCTTEIHRVDGLAYEPAPPIELE
jgi:hypothetical protein